MRNKNKQSTEEIAQHFCELNERIKVLTNKANKLKEELKKRSASSGSYNGYTLSVIEKESYKLRDNYIDIIEKDATLNQLRSKILTKITILDEGKLKSLIEDNTISPRSARKLYETKKQIAYMWYRGNALDWNSCRMLRPRANIK
jgi:uncharacterized small protein (DUF1192 family)